MIDKLLLVSVEVDLSMDFSMCIEISLTNICPMKSYPRKVWAASLSFTDSQCFQECFPNFCNGSLADTVIKNLWYRPIQEFVSSENVGFQPAKTEILFQSKIISFQLVEYSRSSDFIRSVYLLLQFIYPL